MSAMPVVDSTRSLSLKLWVVMNRALRSVEEHLRRQVERHGVSYTEFAIMEVLLHKGPRPIGEIGGLVLLSSGSMTYVIDKLERRGLIRRATSVADRRVIRIELSTEGRSFIERVFDEHAALIDKLMEGVSSTDKEFLIQGLKRMGLHANDSFAASS